MLTVFTVDSIPFIDTFTTVVRHCIGTVATIQTGRTCTVIFNNCKEKESTNTRIWDYLGNSWFPRHFGGQNNAEYVIMGGGSEYVIMGVHHLFTGCDD